MFKSNSKMFLLFSTLFVVLIGLSLYTQGISYAYTQTQPNLAPNIAATEATLGMVDKVPYIPNIVATHAVTSGMVDKVPYIPNIVATHAVTSGMVDTAPQVSNIIASFKMRMAFSSKVYFK